MGQTPATSWTLHLRTQWLGVRPNYPAKPVGFSAVCICRGVCPLCRLRRFPLHFFWKIPMRRFLYALIPLIGFSICAHLAMADDCICAKLPTQQLPNGDWMHYAIVC